MKNIGSTHRFKEILKLVAYRYLGLGKPYYPYMLDPRQLSKLILKIDELFEQKQRPIRIYEIGVARGLTTAFLASHIVFEKLPHTIKCIDTFSGFTKSDLEYEINSRGKKKSDLLGFGYNEYNIWSNNFRDYKFITAIKSDISKYTIRENEVIDIVLADVDLYIPTQSILEKFYDKLTPGGLIMVDDVKNASCWDGAHQAYHEFCDKKNISPNIIGRKCGIIEKPV